MEEEIVIQTDNLCKIYKLYANHTDRLKEAVNILRRGRKYHKDFYALRDVGLQVKKGEMLGIIGKNGSGKSTLLKIISGVLASSSGAVEVKGKIAALLELGVGFNPDMTGRENIYLSGTLLGYSKDEIDYKLGGIIAFADIGEFIYQPVKTYSSGMLVRLGFALAINVDPDILIIDESLAVGDIRFQQKCFRKIKDFRERDKTILFVSHDIGAVNNFCSKAVWLKEGELFRSGKPEEVTKEYVSYMAYDSVATSGLDKEDGERAGILDIAGAKIPQRDVSNCSSFGDRGAEIKRVAFYERVTKNELNVVKGGEDVVFSLYIEAYKEIYLPIYGFILKDEYGNKIIGINSYIYAVKTPPLRKSSSVIVYFYFKFPLLKNGFYTLSPAIAEGTQENHIQHHWVHDGYVLQVSNNDIRHRIGCYFVIDKADIEISLLK